MVRKSKEGLLIFDEDSPLFVKKKTPVKGNTKVKSKISDEILQIEAPQVVKTPKRKAVTQKPKNKNVPKYVIKSPSDCKHILPAFKKKLASAWKKLESKNRMKAMEVVNYIRGVAIVVKEKRPNEYEELMVLTHVAKKLLDKQE